MPKHPPRSDGQSSPDEVLRTFRIAIGGAVGTVLCASAASRRRRRAADDTLRQVMISLGEMSTFLPHKKALLVRSPTFHHPSRTMSASSLVFGTRSPTRCLPISEPRYARIPPCPSNPTVTTLLLTLSITLAARRSYRRSARTPESRSPRTIKSICLLDPLFLRR